MLLGVVALIAAHASTFAAQTVTLAWNPSSDPNVVGYKVYYGTIHGIYDKVALASNATTLTISGLQEGVCYYFSATACSSSGSESEFSNEVSHTVPAGAVLAISGGRTNGTLVISISASGTIPTRWAVQSSSDLKNWGTLARGTNSPVQVSTVVNASSRRFFRLKSE